MKAVFTCDDVFDILTREPFPSGGAEDEFVESHLAVCHECRQLAEAFRPAVGLFHESMAAGGDDELPMYCGRLMPIIDALPQPQRAAVLPSRNAFTMIVLVIAASVVLIGSAVFATLAVNEHANGRGAVASSMQLHQNRNFALLAALEIPTECHSTTTAMTLVSAADVACCTKCHNAGSRVASTEKAIVKSSAACVACHEGLLGGVLSSAARWQGPAIEYDRIQIHFRKSYRRIDVRLVTESTDAGLYVRSASGRPIAVNAVLLALLNARSRERHTVDTAASEHCGWRKDAGRLKPGLLA
jgi:hypothetical protein